MEQQTTKPIQENLWWAIAGKLAGVRKPTAEGNIRTFDEPTYN